MGRRQPRQPNRIPTGVVFGLVLAGIGGLALVHNLGYLEVEDLFRLWPGFLLFMGMVSLINHGPLKVGGHVLIVIGLFLMAGFNNYAPEAERFWPLGIVWVGLVMTLKALLRPRLIPTQPTQDVPAPLPEGNAAPQDESSRQS